MCVCAYKDGMYITFIAWFFVETSSLVLIQEQFIYAICTLCMVLVQHSTSLKWTKF